MPQENIFYIRQVPVYIRDLPSGDAVVWHPYNASVREIVEPICRSRGYWRSQFNNWVIFSCHKAHVIDAIRKAERGGDE